MGYLDERTFPPYFRSAFITVIPFPVPERLHTNPPIVRESTRGYKAADGSDPWITANTEGNSVTHRRILYRGRPAWQQPPLRLPPYRQHAPRSPTANPLAARRLRFRFRRRLLRRVMPQPPSSGPALLVPVPSARGGTRAVDFILLPRGGSWARRGVLGWGFPLLGLWEVPSPAARAGAPLGRSAAPRAWCACRAACSLVLFGCGVLWPASGGFLCGVRWLSPLCHSTLLA